VYFWLGNASIQDHQCVAAASANPHSSQDGRTNTPGYSITHQARQRRNKTDLNSSMQP
jgi:hypothetical protein